MSVVRRFLLWPAAAARHALTASGLLAPLRKAFRWLVAPVPGRERPGPLREDTARTLLATAEALAGTTIERAHYEEFFRWRAEHLPGHRALYDRFAATVDRAARRSHGRDFSDCDPGARLEIIRPAFGVRAVRGRLARARTGALRRKWLLFDLYIVREILLLFAWTDAWRMAGYESWPATPRGLGPFEAAQREALGRMR